MNCKPLKDLLLTGDFLKWIFLTLLQLNLLFSLTEIWYLYFYICKQIFQLSMPETAIYLSPLAYRLKHKFIHFCFSHFLCHKSDLVDFFAPHVWVSASHSLSFWPVAPFDNSFGPYKSRCKCRSITIFRFQFLRHGPEELNS